MSKALYIAEKPSVAQEFAKALKINGQRRDGYLESQDSVVTWCVGHLVTMSYPEKYDIKYKRWSLDTLPFLPREFKYEVIPGVQKQFEIVKGLLNREDVDTIYVCTDSGREGEYIYRLVAQMAGVRGKKEKRVWIDSQTEEEIMRGIREAKDLSAYDNLSASAYLRAKEDYLMGINFSRVLTLRYGNSVSNYLNTKYQAISVGRVMTCVLGMVVRREREIRAFVKTPFYRVLSSIALEEENFEGEWRAVEGSRYFQSPYLYKENGFRKKEHAQMLIDQLMVNQPLSCIVEKVERKKENKNPPHQWFRNRIEEYKGKLNVLLAEGNESLYSYYLALLRTVNSLVQYEEFMLSADIFYLLFPSFEMFEHKLKSVLELEKKVTPTEIEQVKKAVFEYVESVNSVIYHNIHTDQVYLMVPGYSGTSFSIPIKLNMAFLWLTDRVALIFGNTERKRKYRCILVPTMEAKPQTKRIEVESNPNDFLVYVKIPQRTLYMPEELMVILIHEMGHYIGGALRCRKERAKQLKKFVIDFLIDCMFKDVYEEEEYKKQNEIVKDGLKKQMKNTIDHFFDDAKISEFYYGDQVVKVLRSACRYILSDSAELMKKSLENVTYNSFRDEKEIEKLIYAYSDLNYRINKNAKDILLWGIAEQKIYDEMEMYKECFSDLIAVKLLDISPEKLVAALNVSEGNTSQVPENQRRLVIQRVLNGGRPEDVEQMDYPDKYLYAYVASCQEWIDEKLGKWKREDLRAIRELYSAVTYNDESHFFDKAYAAILNCIQNMKSEIDEEIKENAS